MLVWPSLLPCLAHVLSLWHKHHPCSNHLSPWPWSELLSSAMGEKCVLLCLMLPAVEWFPSAAVERNLPHSFSTPPPICSCCLAEAFHVSDVPSRVNYIASSLPVEPFGSWSAWPYWLRLGHGLSLSVLSSHFFQGQLLLKAVFLPFLLFSQPAVVICHFL